MTLLDELGAFADPDAAESTRALFENLSDDAFIQMMTERPQAYHALEGFRLDVGELVEYDEILPNSFGGEPFPGLGTVELSEVVDADGCAQIRLTVVPDPENFARILLDSLVAVGVAEEDSMVSDPEVGEVLRSMAIENVVVGHYDFETGRLWRLTATQTFVTPERSRVDSLTITDVAEVDDLGADR